MVIRDREYLKKEIIGQSRHQFIYGYNDENRKSLIKELEIEYPIKVNENIPIILNLKNWALPNLFNNNIELDENVINILSRDYLNIVIVSEIISKIKNGDFKIESIINLFNRFLTTEYPRLTTLEDLMNVLEKTKEIYMTSYIKYIQSGKIDEFFKEVPINFIILEQVILYIKNVVNNKSYFVIIIDNDGNEKLIHSIKVINDLINSRINSNISIKVFTEPDKWKTFIGSNGQFIESIHDYGEIEIDSSNQEYTRKLKKKNSLLFDE